MRAIAAGADGDQPLPWLPWPSFLQVSHPSIEIRELFGGLSLSAAPSMSSPTSPPWQQFCHARCFHLALLLCCVLTALAQLSNDTSPTSVFYSVSKAPLLLQTDTSDHDVHSVPIFALRPSTLKS